MTLDEFGIVAQLALAVAATVASAVSVVVTRRSAAHEFHLVSTAILHDLTTGEVATARDVVGTLMYGRHDAVERLEIADVIRAYYTLLWCLERVAMGYAGLSYSKDTKLVERFAQSVEWHSSEIATNLALIHKALEVSDKAAWASLKNAVDLLAGHPRLNRMSLPRGKHAARLQRQRGLARRVALLA